MLKTLVEKYKNIGKILTTPLDPDVQSFVSQMEETVNEWFCNAFQVQMNAEDYKNYLPVVGAHIKRHYTDFGVQNAWYVWHTAHTLGILEKGMPTKNAPLVDCESLRRSEIVKAGGYKALEAHVRSYHIG